MEHYDNYVLDLDMVEHSVYSLYYHSFYVIGYRKNEFAMDPTVDFLETKIRAIADIFNFEVLDLECDRDHFQMLFEA